MTPSRRFVHFIRSVSLFAGFVVEYVLGYLVRIVVPLVFKPLSELVIIVRRLRGQLGPATIIRSGHGHFLPVGQRIEIREDHSDGVLAAVKPDRTRASGFELAGTSSGAHRNMLGGALGGFDAAPRIAELGQQFA
jgi:hypothetical protein